MDYPLISVIVPIYNVEKYLCRCLDSLLNQTYRNLEIILIDDGATDNSPAICDEYKKKDKRVQVLHVSNGGSSKARNLGLSLAKGKYIGYIDSDDWIAKDMYEYLLKILLETNADCSQIAFKETKCYMETVKQDREKVEGFVGKEILQYYMQSSTKTGSYSVCRCLFSKEVLEALFFREGFINEDIDFKYKALSRCNKLVVSNQIKYFYFQGGKATNSTGGLKRKDFQLYDAADALYMLTKDEKYGTIARLGRVKKARTAYSLLAKIAYYGIADKSINKKKTIKKLVKENRKNWCVLMNSPIGIKRKIVITFFAISYRMTELFIRLLTPNVKRA